MKLQPTIMFTMRNNYESSDLTIPKGKQVDFTETLESAPEYLALWQLQKLFLS